MKNPAAVLVSAALLLGLAGCSFSASVYPTVSAKSVANTGAKALEKIVGLSSLPKVDCGSGKVDLIVGKKVKCTATDPTNDKTYNATITITKVKGSDYSIHIQVSKTPIN